MFYLLLMLVLCLKRSKPQPSLLRFKFPCWFVKAAMSQTCITAWCRSPSPQSCWKHVWQANLCEIVSAWLSSYILPVLSAACFSFSLVCEIQQRRTRVANLTAVFCKKKKKDELLEWRGMSHCAMSLWHATALHGSAERDFAVCQRRPHSFPGTRVDTSLQWKLAVWGQHLFFFFFPSWRTD